MDFSFSSDQQLLKNSARAFLDEHCKPATVRLLWDDPRGESEVDVEGDGPARLARASPCPRRTAAAGSAWSRPRSCSRSSAAPPIPARTCRPSWPPPPSSAAGTDAQKKRWLSAIATGDARATVAFLDGDLDWDPAAMTTRAEKSSKGWTAVRDEALRAVGPRGQRAADPGARARGPVAVPRRSARRQGSSSRRSGHGSGDALGPSRAGRGAGGRRRRARRSRSGRGRSSSGLLRRGAVGARGRDAGRRAPVPGHGGRLRQGARAVRPADRLLPGDPPQVRRDAPRGRELPLGRVLRGLGARREGGRSRAGGVGREGLRRRRRRARSAARRSRCTAASASPGSTTCTSTSSAPRRSRSMYGDVDYHREQIVRRAAR